MTAPWLHLADEVRDAIAAGRPVVALESSLIAQGLPVSRLTCSSDGAGCMPVFDAHGHICAVLSPSREIKIFAEGAEVFTFRGAAWHLLDLQATREEGWLPLGDLAIAEGIVTPSQLGRSMLPEQRQGVREPQPA